MAGCRDCPDLRDAFRWIGPEAGFSDLKRKTGWNDHKLQTHLRHLQEDGEVGQAAPRGPYVLFTPGETQVTHDVRVRRKVVLPPAELSFRGELSMKVTRHDGRVEYYGPEG